MKGIIYPNPSEGATIENYVLFVLENNHDIRFQIKVLMILLCDILKIQNENVIFIDLRQFFFF